MAAPVKQPKKSREEVAKQTRADQAQARERGRKMHQKEMVLLQRRLEAHYGLMKQFIRTRSEPTIFYLPVKHTSKTERYLEETKVAIEQKISSLKAHLQALPPELAQVEGVDDSEAENEDVDEEEEEEEEE